MAFLVQPIFSIAQTQGRIKDRESLRKEMLRHAALASDYKAPMKVENVDILTKADVIRRMDKVMSQLPLEYKGTTIDNSAYHEKFKSKSCFLVKEIPIGYAVNGILNGVYSLWECSDYYATVEIFMNRKGQKNKNGILEEAENDVVNGYKASTRYYVSQDGRTKSVYAWKDVEKMVEFTVYDNDNKRGVTELRSDGDGNRGKDVDNRNRDMAALLE